MSTNTEKRDDTRILLAVAGLVVAGAAGLALLAGLDSASQGSGTVDGRAEALEPEVEATRFAGPRDFGEAPIETAAFGRMGASTTPLAIDVPTEPSQAAFRIEPGENLVAGGLEAWNRGDYERAAAYFDAQTRARDTDAWSHYMLGLSHWKAGRPDDAVAALERSAELDPAFIGTPINLARIQNDRGDFEAALSAAMTALAIDPEAAPALFLEGRSLYNLGRADEALNALERSIAADAANGYVHNLLGLALLEKGDSVRAAAALERAAELEPNVAFIQNNLGMAAEHCGERDTAIAAYRRALALDAGYGKALRNLARLDSTPPEETDIVETASSGSLD